MQSIKPYSIYTWFYDSIQRSQIPPCSGYEIVTKCSNDDVTKCINHCQKNAIIKC